MAQRLVVAAALVAAWSCALFAQAASAQDGDCSASLETVWLGRYQAVAAAAGPCGEATLTLDIVDPALGQVVHSAAFSQAHLFGFEAALDVASMEAALQEWVGYASVEGASVVLPLWPQGASEPEPREFPFYPAEGLARGAYEQARQADWPTLCYIQGMESYLCLAEDPQSMRLLELGVQTFPG